jgi:D-glycero-alpha-D-manno-heptose-7-phosphate kinase
MVEQAYYGEQLLLSRQWDEFGKLLDQAWKFKKSLSRNVMTSVVDDIYAEGLKAGALGGKLLGGGGSGFILFYVPHLKHVTFKRVFERWITVSFKADYEGSTLVTPNPHGQILQTLLQSSKCKLQPHAEPLQTKIGRL